MAGENHQEPLRAGLVGLGRWGRSIARTVREEVPALQLHRVASGNAQAQEIAGEGCHVHSDWRELLTCGDLDAILLAVPARLHREIAGAVIESGIPLFMEKPMALNVADAESLCALGRSAQAIARVDHVDLHNPAVVRIRQELNGKGSVRSIDGRIGAAYDRRADIAPLWEYSPHFLAVSIELMGKMPTTVAARNLPRETEPYDDPSKEIVALDLDFEGGARVHLEVGNGMRDKTREMTVQGSETTYRYVDRGRVPLSRAAAGKEAFQPIAVEPTLPLTAAIRDFADAVRRGDPDFAGLEMGLDVVRILDAASRAQVSGKPEAIG